MRRLSRDHKEWLDRRVRIGHKRLLRTARMLGRPAARAARRWQTSIIVVPALLSTENEEARRALAKTLTALITALEKPLHRVRLDFTATHRLFPGGTLILLAYIEMLLRLHPGRLSARCISKSLAAQLLQQFGVAHALGLQPASCAPVAASVTSWRYLTGTRADGEKISELLNYYRQLSSADPPEGLYESLTEALTNVRHHAYPPGDAMPESLQRWWLFARFDEPTPSSQGRIFIAVYDMGVGIQASLRRRLERGEAFLEKGEEAAKFLGAHPRTLERILLERAVDHQRSSTGLSNRGHGLPEMRDFVLRTQSGRLYINSGFAHYACLAQVGFSEVVPCSYQFPGTLIVWSIPLNRREASL